jgi:microcystin-dependent protein
LFAVIGTQFGEADGVHSFALPDFRGRFPLGLDNMGGTSANRVTAAAADVMGGNGGAETVTLTAAQLPAHNHPIKQGSASSGSTNIGASILRDRNAAPTDVTDIIQNNTGGGGAHENLPPYQTISFIIYTGV